MGMIRILFLTDIRLGFALPFRPRIQRPRRGAEFFANFKRTLEFETDGLESGSLSRWRFHEDPLAIDHSMPVAVGFKKNKQAFHQLSHEPVVQFFHGIRSSMIVGIAEKSGVRDHDRLESLIPERGMVTEPD